MITTFGPAPLGERDRGLAVGGLADHADVGRARERQPQAFADDLVVVDDQAGDLVRAHGQRDLWPGVGRQVISG